MIILDYLRQRFLSPDPQQNPPQPCNFERTLLAFDGMEDLLETRKTEPLHKRISPFEPRKTLLASFLFFQVVIRSAWRTQEKSKPLMTLDRLVVCRRFTCNFFNNVSSFVDFTVRPRLGELFPGIFGDYDYQLLGLEIQDREIADEFEIYKPELIFQKSIGKKITRGVRSAGREVRRSSRKTARVFKKAGKKTGKWIKDHPGETVVIGVVVAAVIITIATAGVGAGVTAATGSALAGATAKNNDNNRPRRIREDEEEQPRPVTPPPINPTPPPTPVQPKYTEPCGVPRELTQPFTPTLPEYIIPPEYRHPTPLPNMPVPIPPIGSPDVPSYRQSVKPIISVPEFTNPGLLQEKRIEPPRTTSPVVMPGSSRGQHVTQEHPRPTLEVVKPQEVTKDKKSLQEENPSTFAEKIDQFDKEAKKFGAHIQSELAHELLDLAALPVRVVAVVGSVALKIGEPVVADSSREDMASFIETLQTTNNSAHEKIDGFFETDLARNYDPTKPGKKRFIEAEMPGRNLPGKVVVILETAEEALKIQKIAQTTGTIVREVAIVEEAALAGRQVATVSETQITGTASKVSRTEPVASLAQESGALKKPDVYAPDRLLPTNKDGVPIREANTEHTQLSIIEGSKGNYVKAREFDKDGKVVRDIEFTDHGRPHDHTNPHQHKKVPNETGGTFKREDPEPVPEWEYVEK